MFGAIQSDRELKQITELHTIFEDGTETFEYLQRAAAHRKWSANKHKQSVKYSCLRECILNITDDVCLKDGKITKMFEYSK